MHNIRLELIASDWIGLDCIELEWNGSDRNGLDWIGFDRNRLDWIATDWIGMEWFDCSIMHISSMCRINFQLLSNYLYFSSLASAIMSTSN